MNYKKSVKNCLFVLVLGCMVNTQVAQENDIVDKMFVWQEKNKNTIQSFLCGFLVGRFSRIVN